MSEDQPADDRPVWNPELAERLHDKKVLIGLTYLTADGAVLDRRQLHGRVVSVDRRKGIGVRLDGAHAGEEFVLPPDTRSWDPAPPGEYRLRGTGELVVDPDFLTTWTVQKPAHH
jgi:hypothetical protein